MPLDSKQGSEGRGLAKEGRGLGKSSGFRFPSGDSRTVVIGATGTGKTTLGAWLLSHARFDARPWVILDYKGEELFDLVGQPPLIRLRLGQLPPKRGLCIVSPRPDQDEAVEAWLWKIWEKGNIGLFVDEAALLPSSGAVKAILRQGRSKRLPLIACTQRPIGIDREFFSEASYVACFRVQDERDYKIVAGFTRKADLSKPLPAHWSHWYDVGEDVALILKPVPPPRDIASRLASVVPQQRTFGLW